MSSGVTFLEHPPIDDDNHSIPISSPSSWCEFHRSPVKVNEPALRPSNFHRKLAQEQHLKLYKNPSSVPGLTQEISQHSHHLELDPKDLNQWFCSRLPPLSSDCQLYYKQRILFDRRHCKKELPLLYTTLDVDVF